jgi:hypothetical protein
LRLLIRGVGKRANTTKISSANEEKGRRRKRKEMGEKGGKRRFIVSLASCYASFPRRTEQNGGPLSRVSCIEILRKERSEKTRGE